METSWKKTGNLIFVLIFLYFSGVKGFITSPPQNTATKVGSQTHLNCSGNNGNAWTFGEPGNGIPLVTLGSLCNVVSNYTSSYRGEAQGSNTCNLIILNPSLQQSGVYSCQDNNVTPKHAVLTVLSSLGTPTVNNGSEVVEGDQLSVTCTVEYGTSISVPVAPILNWTISGINITNAETTKTSISVTSSITVVAKRDGIPSYDCTAHFLPPASTSNNFALNAPSTVYIGATYPITGVYYAPTTPVISRRIANVTEHSAIVCAFSELTCSSSANPSPIYTWTDGTTGSVLANGNVLALAEDNRTYRCTASNKVNSSYAAYTTGINQPSQCGDKLAQYQTDKTAAIILGVLFGVSLLVIGALILFVILRKMPVCGVQKTRTSSTIEQNRWQLETVNHPVETSPPSAYQELDPLPNRDQPNQYERLTPDTQYINLENAIH